MSNSSSINYSNDDYDTTGIGKGCIVTVQQSLLYRFMVPEKKEAIHCDDGDSDFTALASPPNV